MAGFDGEEDVLKGISGMQEEQTFCYADRGDAQKICTLTSRFYWAERYHSP
jgi:hypothetical protein